LTTTNITLSDLSILVIFALTNSAPDPVLCDVSLFADTCVGANEWHVVQTFPDGQGFFWSGDYEGVEYTMNPVIRHDPLVSDASAYWFGPFQEINSGYWNQTTLNHSVGIDIGITVSWQGISVPGRGSTGVSVMFRSGIHNTERPVVRGAAAGQDGFVLFNQTLPVRFSVSNLRYDGWIRAFVVFDADITSIRTVPGSWSEEWMTGEVDPEGHMLQYGPHVLSLYAVDDLGLVSDAAQVMVQVVGELPKTDNSSKAGIIAGITLSLAVVVGVGLALGIWCVWLRPGRPRGGFKHLGDVDMEPGGVAL
jgi:hypothetical protein